jgi:hypothetical protein
MNSPSKTLHASAMEKARARMKANPGCGCSAKQANPLLASRQPRAMAPSRPVLPPVNQPCTAQQIANGCQNGSDSQGNTKCVCPVPKMGAGPTMNDLCPPTHFFNGKWCAPRPVRQANPPPARRSVGRNDVQFGVYHLDGREQFVRDHRSARMLASRLSMSNRGQQVQYRGYRGDGNGGWVIGQLQSVGGTRANPDTQPCKCGMFSDGSCKLCIQPPGGDPLPNRRGTRGKFVGLPRNAASVSNPGCGCSGKQVPRI